MSWWLTLGSPWWSTLVKSLGPSLLTGHTSDWEDYCTSWGRHAAPTGLIISPAGAKPWCQPIADPCGVFKSGQLLDGARHFFKSALLFSVSTYFDVLRFSRGAVLSSSLTDSQILMDWCLSNSWICRCLRTAVFRFLSWGPFQRDPPPRQQLVTEGWKWRQHTWRPIISSVTVTAWQEERCCE